MTAKNFKHNVKTGLIGAVSLSIACLLVLLIISTLETVYVWTSQGFSQTPLVALGIGWLNDLLFWSRYSLYLLSFYLVIHFITPRLASTVFLIIFSLLCLVDLLLNVYFSVTSIPLGSEFIQYSPADILQTVGSSGILSPLKVILLIMAAILIVAGLKFMALRLQPVLSGKSLFFFLFLWLVPGFIKTGSSSYFRSDFTNNLVLNKSDLFYTDIIANFFPEDEETDIYAEGYLGVYTSQPTNQLAPAEIHYVDEQRYPFLHADNTPDVLSAFFQKSEKLPNIVIILVEGLGTAFSNEDAYLGSFTPFIDSLSGQSLYFSNFLSAGGRTFAALPSLLASLPFAKNGFLELGTQMPPHLSLLNILKTSGYTTSFYYGGDSHFDNMDVFLRQNGIDELHDGKTFPAGYTKLPAYNGFTWGYDDLSLYKRYLDSRSPEANKPQLSILLTVSSHSPFRINDQDKYLNLLDKHLAGQHSKEDAKSYQNYRYEYASILYTDKSLQTFFDQYKKRPDFKNTIFLITGDHRMPEIPMSTKIDRYHVPLIIYSPLLKRTAKIKSVSSHLDLTPSLLSFLSQQYGLKRPSLCSWVGGGLDTSAQFRNIHNIPLIQTKTKCVDFLAGNYHLNDHSVYQLSDNLESDLMEDEALSRRMQDAFAAYKKRNERFLKERKLVPDSILNKYSSKSRDLSSR